MEDTLRVNEEFRLYIKRNKVLILVLMEDTLRAEQETALQYASIVLILVLMEDTLRATMSIIINT